MTDDELQARLRRLAATGAEPDWDAMAADVRAAYERQARAPARRRRRWLAAPVAAALALAAACVFFVRAQHHAHQPTLPLDDEAAVIADDPDPDALIDDLTPAQLDRVAQALKQGA